MFCGCIGVRMSSHIVRVSVVIERVVRIAADVDCQWDLYLINTYSLKELQQLDFSTIKLPLEWFEDWRSELDAP